MYAGRKVEEATAGGAVRPSGPSLHDGCWARSRISTRRRVAALAARGLNEIKGMVPSLFNLPPVAASRRAVAWRPIAAASRRRRSSSIGPGHLIACWNAT
jgi:peptide/nickel transport system ATP-binding protein/oligopeptide transport system ATP-binding protein